MDSATFSSTGTREAGLDDRFIAAFIDIIALAVLFVAMSFVFRQADTDWSANSEGVRHVRVGLTGGPFILYLLLCVAYYVVLEALTDRTLGKVIMKLRVVKFGGGACDWKDAVVRNVLRPVDWFPVFYIVGLVSILVTDDNQRLGDVAAKTTVVRVS